MVRPYLSSRVGVFVGGSTEWKLSTMAGWARLAHECGARCHVGRVNSALRARLCDIAGADSIDGSKASRYEFAPALIDRGLAQIDLEGWLSREATPRTP